MAQVYVWGKYNLNVKYEEDHSAQDPKQGDINNFWVGKSYSFSAVNGKYTLNNALEMSRENDAAQYPYAIDGAMTGDGVYYAEEAYGINKTAGWISSSGKLAYRIPDTLSGKIFYPVYYGVKTIKEKGAYIEDVTSESENTYPKDGISGNYYYVFKYAVPGVPSITVPGAAMIGHAVDISWEAADSAESYKLERRVDSGGWTQVYAGDDLTYTDTAQSGWTSVQYRISAGISGVYGGLTVSNVVSIIPVSSLVISGTDGNLGTAKAPVTYSVTSDTDSPITVTEIINGHERTLTPASGQTITIPVSMLDPGAGAITIKASVQAASGAVNQTRNWTYTKTSLALPVAPYRVERLQGKECDVMPQTLAEAVFMPDGSSVAGPMIGRNVIRSYPVASGQSIQAGDVVDVVEGKAQKTLTPVANVETVLLERAVTHMAVCDLNSEYAVVADSKDNGSNHAAFLISKKTGKRVGDNNYANETTITGLSIARLSDTQFLIGYVENRALYVKLGTVSGNSISFSQSESVDTAFYNLFALAELTNGRVAVVYSALIAGSNKLRMRVFTLSSSSLGSIYTRDITGESSGEISATSMNDGRVCICYVDLNDGNKGKVLIAAVDSSNAVTWGDVAVFNDTYTAKPRCASNQKGNVVISYYSSSPVGVAARTYIVSGNTIIPRFAPLQITSTSGVIENTIAQIPGACVVSCENGNAYLLLNEGSELSLAATYKFLHSSGTSKSLDITAIANKQVLLCYSAAGNSGYGTSTILTASGNQIAGSFIDGSQDAIALKSGTAGQSIEVIYSGTVAADWVTEGQVITSPGVYGAGVLAGVLQVWSKDRPDNVVTGTYIGDGAPSQTIQLGFTPKAVLVCQNGILSRGYQSHYAEGLALDGYPAAESNSNVVSVVEGGFQVFDGTSANSNGRTNVASQKYYYLTWK